MNKFTLIFGNVLIYWVVVDIVSGLSPGSFGRIFALFVGGLAFALAALAVDPLLGFFKFPSNFWGWLVVGLVINSVLFLILSTGILPSILVIKSGSIGGGFSPIPIPVIKLGSSVMVAFVGAILATLLQISFRKFGSS